MDHLKIELELTERDACDIGMLLNRCMRMIDETTKAVKRKRSWPPSVKAAILASYEHERRTLSTLAANIERAFTEAERGNK